LIDCHSAREGAEMKHFRILIVDESPFFRNWFRRLILTIPKIQVIGEAKDALSALCLLRRVKPDAIIIDVKTQWRFGTDLIKSFRQITPISKVIVLTSEGYRRYQTKALGKADVLLDKITEYNKIPEILNRFASGSVSLSHNALLDETGS
jgi:DNA-binding NarL/FixJ family response regulator